MQMYYTAMLASPMNTKIIPPIMGVMVLAILAKIVRTRSGKAFFLAFVFAAATPFFEMVLKPAELAFTQSTNLDSAEAMEHRTNIRNGHFLLGGLCCLVILLGLADPAPSAAAFKRD